jgi:hypothetical protein
VNAFEGKDAGGKPHFHSYVSADGTNRGLYTDDDLENESKPNLIGSYLHQSLIPPLDVLGGEGRAVRICGMLGSLHTIF